MDLDTMITATALFEDRRVASVWNHHLHEMRSRGAPVDTTTALTFEKVLSRERVRLCPYCGHVWRPRDDLRCPRCGG